MLCSSFKNINTFSWCMSDSNRVVELTGEKVAEYVSATGDSNPLHSPSVMRSKGVHAVIPGLQIFSAAIGDVDVSDFNRVSLVLGSPAFAGDTLELTLKECSQGMDIQAYRYDLATQKRSSDENLLSSSNGEKSRIFTGEGAVPDEVQYTFDLYPDVDLRTQLGAVLEVNDPRVHYNLGRLSSALIYAIRSVDPMDHSGLLGARNLEGEDALAHMNYLRQNEHFAMYSAVDFFWPEGIRSIGEGRMEYGVNVFQKSKRAFDFKVVASRESMTRPLYVASSELTFVPQKIFYKKSAKPLPKPLLE